MRHILQSCYFMPCNFVSPSFLFPSFSAPPKGRWHSLLNIRTTLLIRKISSQLNKRRVCQRTLTSAYSRQSELFENGPCSYFCLISLATYRPNELSLLHCVRIMQSWMKWLNIKLQTWNYRAKVDCWCFQTSRRRTKPNIFIPPVENEVCRFDVIRLIHAAE